MSIYDQLRVDDVKQKAAWAIRGPDRPRGYWTRRLPSMILRRLRYERMYARGQPRVHRAMKYRHRAPYEAPVNVVSSREASMFRALSLIEKRAPTDRHKAIMRRMARKLLRRPQRDPVEVASAVYRKHLPALKEAFR